MVDSLRDQFSSAEDSGLWPLDSAWTSGILSGLRVLRERQPPPTPIDAFESARQMCRDLAGIDSRFARTLIGIIERFEKDLRTRVDARYRRSPERGR